MAPNEQNSVTSPTGTPPPRRRSSWAQKVTMGSSSLVDWGVANRGCAGALLDRGGTGPTCRISSALCPCSTGGASREPGVRRLPRLVKPIAARARSRRASDSGHLRCVRCPARPLAPRQALRRGAVSSFHDLRGPLAPAPDASVWEATPARSETRKYPAPCSSPATDDGDPLSALPGTARQHSRFCSSESTKDRSSRSSRADI